MHKISKQSSVSCMRLVKLIELDFWV